MNRKRKAVDQGGHGDKSRRVQFVETADYTRKNLSSGRRERHNVRNAWKRIQAGTQIVDMRFAGITPFEGTGGYFVLANSQRLNPTALTGQYTNNFPCHIYDISSFAVNKASGVLGVPPVLTVAKPMTVMCATNPAAVGNRQITFQYGTGQLAPDSTGTTAQWQYMRTREGGQGASGTGGVLFPTNSDAQRDILSFVNAKMLFYGRQGNATRFTVQLIQLSMPTYATPKWLADNLPSSFASSNSEDRSYVNTVWENFLSKEIFSPVQTFGGGGLAAKFIKILKQHQFIIQGSTDVNQLHQHQLNLFHRFNRRQKYDWEPSAISTGTVPSTATTSVDELQNTAAAPQEQGTLTEYVHPRARIYLVIKAQSTCSATDALVTDSATYKKSQLNQPLLWPSYDINLNVRHLVAI